MTSGKLKNDSEWFSACKQKSHGLTSCECIFVLTACRIVRCYSWQLTERDEGLRHPWCDNQAEYMTPYPPWAHLCQPLLTLSVSGGNQCLLGLVNEERRALHDVTSGVQHGGSSFGVCGGGSDAAGRLGQSFQGLSRLPGCYSYTQDQRLQNVLVWKYRWEIRDYCH